MLTPSSFAQLIDESIGASSWITENDAEVLEILEVVLVIESHPEYEDVLTWSIHTPDTGVADAFASGDVDETDLHQKLDHILTLVHQ